MTLLVKMLNDEIGRLKRDVASRDAIIADARSALEKHVLTEIAVFDAIDVHAILSRASDLDRSENDPVPPIKERSSNRDDPQPWEARFTGGRSAERPNEPAWDYKPRKCICDGGAVEIQEHPFIVNPSCEIHGPGHASLNDLPKEER